MDFNEQTEAEAALTVLVAAEQRRRKHTSDRDMAVQLCRARGATWAQIGQAIGMTRQGAEKAFRIQAPR